MKTDCKCNQERYDLNNSVFDDALFEGWHLNGNGSGTGVAPWSANDIVIVSSYATLCVVFPFVLIYS